MSMIQNNEKSRIETTITPRQLGEAMSHLDLSSIPREKRKDAIKDHLIRVMSETACSPAIRSALNEARILHAKAKG